MARVRFSMLKSLCNSINPTFKLQSFQSYNSYTKLASPANPSFLRSSYAFSNHNCYQEPLKLSGNLPNAHLKILSSDSPVDTQCYKTKPITAFSPTSTNLCFRSVVPYISMSPMLSHRSYSWSSGGKVDKHGAPDVSAASGGTNVDVGNSVVGSDWIDKVKDAWQSAVDAVTYTGQKAKETSDGLTPYIQQLLDSHPYLKNVVVPVGWTLTGTILAWLVMPRLLRRFHKYAMQTPAVLLSGSISGDQFPYEKSFWGALENPVRYLITFMAFSQMFVVPTQIFVCSSYFDLHVSVMFFIIDYYMVALTCSAVMVAPTTIASQYIAQAWRGAVILSFVWFLHRWKTNVFSRALAAQNLAVVDREKMLTLDRLSSVGLFVIGIMALAEACGVAVQSILTVGGIGGECCVPSMIPPIFLLGDG